MADIRRTSEYRKLLPFIAGASGDVGDDTIGEDVQALLQALNAHKTSDDHDGRYYTETEVNSALGLKADKTITLTAGEGLTGGGDLSAGRTFDVVAGLGIGFDSSGNVIVDLTDNFAWTGNHSFSQTMYAGSIMPHVSDTYDLGSMQSLWRKIFASELSAVVFSKYEQVLLGGWFTVSKGEGVLPADVISADTVIDLGAGTFDDGDILVFRGVENYLPKMEYVRVVSRASGTTYNVIRGFGSTGANDWQAGTVFANWGTAGDGRIELNAYDSPRISVFSHDPGYSKLVQHEQVRIGDLLNGWGYSASTYGGAFGAYENGKANITIDPTNGIRIRNYDQTVIQLTGTEARFENVIKLGTNGRLQQGTGTWGTDFTGTALWNDSGVMNVGGWNNNVKQWWGGNSGNLYAGGGDVVLNENGIAIHSAIGDELYSPDVLKFQDLGGTEFVMAKMWAFKSYGTFQANNLWLETETDNATYGTSITLVAHKTVGGSADDAQMTVFSKAGTTPSWIKLLANDILLTGNVVVDGTIKDVNGVAYLKTTGKAADSDKLDGLDSTAFGRPVFLTTPLFSTSWTGNPRSTNETAAALNLNTVFGVPTGVKAVLMRLVGRDSAAVGTAGMMVLVGPNATDCYANSVYPIGGDIYCANTTIVPVSSGLYIYYKVRASGTNTMDVWIDIWGYWL